ncbi:unnamed protein product [Prunus armeniaca]|uniref:KIB1-4 beta-propeller domain-containing protein n=1 Tax=Prunus armeniaca TaxID=36596 RepID=A0A6J5W456_PRUAR|nr:unnamed protein product [Prunus armeniaca]
MSSFNSNKKPCRRTPAVSFSSGGWASLPMLVFFILDKLLEPIDHVGFAAVCKQWRGIIHNRGKVLYNISEGIIHNNIELQVPFSKRRYGFSHGWLATVDPTTYQSLIIALSNPFTKAKPILLPPLIGRVREHEGSYYEHYVRKIILSTHL